MQTSSQLNTLWQHLRDTAVPAGLSHLGNTYDEVLMALRRKPDLVLAALIESAQTNDQENSQSAGTIIVQALLPKLIKMSRSQPDLELGDFVSELWLIITHYPLARRPQSIAANLCLDTAKSLRAKNRTLLFVPTHHDTDPEAVTVLRRAAGAGLISAKASQILTEVYLDAQPRYLVAANYRLSESALRQTCSRALRKLAQHRIALVA